LFYKITEFIRFNSKYNTWTETDSSVTENLEDFCNKDVKEEEKEEGESQEKQNTTEREECVREDEMENGAQTESSSSEKKSELECEKTTAFSSIKRPSETPYSTSSSSSTSLHNTQIDMSMKKQRLCSPCISSKSSSSSSSISSSDVKEDNQHGIVTEKKNEETVYDWLDQQIMMWHEQETSMEKSDGIKGVQDQLPEFIDIIQQRNQNNQQLIINEMGNRLTTQENNATIIYQYLVKASSHQTYVDNTISLYQHLLDAMKNTIDSLQQEVKEIRNFISKSNNQS